MDGGGRCGASVYARGEAEDMVEGGGGEVGVWGGGQKEGEEWGGARGDSDECLKGMLQLYRDILPSDIASAKYIELS